MAIIILIVIIVAATALAIVSIQDLYNTISCTFCSPDEIKAQCQG